jgi:pimeloyl-ACP methyl ester carboxylesterase
MLWIEEVGKGPPLIMLHAAATSERIWWQHIPRLARSFRVVTIDLPGHGRSSKKSIQGKPG